MMNYQPNFGHNQMAANGGAQINHPLNQQLNQQQLQQLNQQQLQQLQSMLMDGQGAASLPELDDEDLDELESFDDEECDEEDFSDENEECGLNLSDYNKLYNGGNVQNKPNNFGQSESNLFEFDSSARHEQANHAANSSSASNGVGFMAPGPNFLNRCPAC